MAAMAVAAAVAVAVAVGAPLRQRVALLHRHARRGGAVAAAALLG